MHVFSAAVENRPKIAIVSWRDDDTMILHWHIIHIHKFQAFFLSWLQFLENFVYEKLLFGHKISEMGITHFGLLQDSIDTTTKGYSPVLGGLNGNVNLEKFLNFLFIIIHITPGSATRITEEIFIQICNTLVGRQHLFVLNGYATLATWSNYWKGAKVSGKFKEILCVMPCQVAKLVLILLWIIRPVEIIYLLRPCVPFNESERELVRVVYASILWVSLGSRISVDMMYESIKAFFRSPDGKPIFSFPINTRVYQHFAKAVQKRHLSHISPRYTKALADAGTQAGDLQAGHTSQTSHQHYAWEEKIVGVDTDFRDHFIAYSLAWHKFWGLDRNGGIRLWESKTLFWYHMYCSGVCSACYNTLTFLLDYEYNGLYVDYHVMFSALLQLLRACSPSDWSTMQESELTRWAGHHQYVMAQQSPRMQEQYLLQWGLLLENQQVISKMLTVVLESPVQSSLSSIFGKTRTGTGLRIF